MTLTAAQPAHPLRRTPLSPTPQTQSSPLPPILLEVVLSAFSSLGFGGWGLLRVQASPHPAVFLSLPCPSEKWPESLVLTPRGGLGGACSLVVSHPQETQCKQNQDACSLTVSGPPPSPRQPQEHRQPLLHCTHSVFS